MNRIGFVALAALVLAAAAAGAQSAQKPAVLLSNAENLELYYAIDPPGLSGPDTSSAVFVGKVVSFFSESTPEVRFSRIEPLGLQRVDGLAEGVHVFVGFFVLKGAADLPVRVVRLQAGGGIEERLYTVYREPATVTVKAGRGRIATIVQVPAAAASSAPSGREPVQQADAGGGAAASAEGPAGGRPADAPSGFWERVEPIVTFTGAFEPEIVVRQTARGTDVIPFAQASYWGVDGVRLRDVRIARLLQEVVFRVQTFGSMSADESVLLYFQEDRTKGTENQVTLELAPVGDGASGYALLWRKGTKGPAIVGTFAQQGNVLLGRVRYADMSPYLDLRAASPQVSIDICTDHHEPSRRAYEEYYQATVRLGQIPVLDEQAALFL